MAYVETAEKDRFSLLLLEPGEIYFEDFSVYYYDEKLAEPEAIKRKQKGRLKVCSKSILFDPQDITLPILKFPLKECVVIENWVRPLLSKLGNKGGVIHIRCNQVVEMLEGGFIAPYKFKREARSCLFALNYVNADDCVSQMSQLRRAATLPAAEQASMIAAIVLSRQSRVSFDTSWLEDLYEKIVMETTGNKITPLVVNPGRILLTCSRLYFQPYNNAEPWPVLKIKLSSITRVVKRRFLLRHVGLELYCPDEYSLKHLFLTFKNKEDRDTLYTEILKQPALRLEDTGQENMTLLWQNGVISNYDYLLYLNSLADRSFNDLTQYPVFPWVIADYTSTHLDLTNPSVYRDLSKSVGALNKERLKKLKQRYDEMSEPKFLYGSHYSTPGFVLYYLVRKMPQYMLCLQNGRFDNPDRMFNSIADTWRNITTNSSDFKELVPQFYDTETKGDFLCNIQHLDFGVRQDGTKVGDVELPPWAEDHYGFVQTLREALESDFVSQHIHEWIDLVFGYKQQGEEAVKANNVFYYLTYEGSVDLDSIKDLNEKYCLEVQIMEFGQIPKQIFVQPHPRRHSLSISVPLIEKSCLNSGKAFSEELVSDKRDSNDEDSQRKLRTNTIGQQWSSSMSSLELIAEHKLHKDAVTAVCISKDSKSVFSVSLDSLLKMYSLEEKRQLRSINISHMALSSCYLMEDGKTIVVGSWDNYVYKYNIEYGKVLENTMAHDDAVTDICWNNDILVTASSDSSAKVWHYGPHQSLRTHSTADLLAELDHEAGVSCVALDRNNTLLVSGTTDGHINIWNLSSFSLMDNFTIHTALVTDVAFSPDSSTIASCSTDQTLKVLDVKTGTQVFSKDAGEELRCLCWDGSTVFTGGERGNIMIWDLTKAQLLNTIAGHIGPVICIDGSEDGSLVVTGGKDKKISVWKTL
ncbi:protein FAN-like isoform X2 [Tachypleus tridentatus]|uniref:protein FAN-like isoform X2 n=1 Tax=Tachypleus tridentatus TaxID=6853 RepID=UPI003FD491B6